MNYFIFKEDYEGFREGEIVKANNVNVKDPKRCSRNECLGEVDGECVMYLDEQGVIELMTTITVWTNGSAIRKYQGQDKVETVGHSRENGWFKAQVLVIEGGVSLDGRIERDEESVETAGRDSS